MENGHESILTGLHAVTGVDEFVVICLGATVRSVWLSCPPAGDAIFRRRTDQLYTAIAIAVSMTLPLIGRIKYI